MSISKNHLSKIPTTFSLKEIHNFAPGTLAILSGFFLLVGIVYNKGVFDSIESGLINQFSIADHFSTAIEQTLTIFLVFSLALFAGFLIVYVFFGLISIPKLLPRKGIWFSPRNLSERTLNKLDKVAEEISFAIYLLIPNAFLLALNFFSVPESAYERFSTSFFFLGLLIFLSVAFIGISKLPVSEKEEETITGSTSYLPAFFRFSAYFILLLLIPYQKGMIDSIHIFRFLNGEKYERLYTINNTPDVYLIRTTGNGVYAAYLNPLSEKGKDRKGEIRFVPWGSITQINSQKDLRGAYY